MIVPDWQAAQTVLEQAGCVVKVTEVLAVAVADRPGGMAHLLEIMDRAGLNIEYMYAFTEKRSDQGILVFRFEDPDAAGRALQAAGVNIVGTVDLFSRA